MTAFSKIFRSTSGDQQLILKDRIHFTSYTIYGEKVAVIKTGSFISKITECKSNKQVNLNKNTQLRFFIKLRRIQLKNI